ncbi:MAG: DUF2157 domain-containing protein [bacterium]|nr:DUF2157 domain-containing protein [bacterium]
MLRADLSQYLVKFAERLGEKEVISSESSIKIKKYLRSEESPAYWNLFLIVSSILGALTVAAGFLVIVGEYWNDFPKGVKGFFGILPVAVAAFFYYRMYTKYPLSGVWIEATSLFLMLMMGASLALTSSTFEFEWEADEGLFTWIVATIPLFYVKRASGIAYAYFALLLVYLSMGAEFSFSMASPIDFGTHGIWFWVFVLAFLPHYFMALDRTKKVQELRLMFLTLLLTSTVFSVLLMTVDSNRLLWIVTWNIGVYLFAQRFMSDHFWFWRRIMIWLPQLVIVTVLLFLSNRFFMMSTFRYDSFFNMDNWTGGEWYYFVLLLVFMAGIYYNYIKFREHYENINQMVLFSPALIVFLMILDEMFDAWWILSLVANLYLLILAVVIMVDGSEQNKFWRVSAGLLLYAAIVLFRFADTNMGFFWKGFLFIGYGGVFFLIVMFMKEKVDRIHRNKHRKID